jgi:hypothetical protein
MKKRTPDNIDDIFRNKFSDFESDPFPDTKEKVFTAFYSEESGKKDFKNWFITLVREYPLYRYAVAAGFIGLLGFAIIFYFFHVPSENNGIAINPIQNDINLNEEFSSSASIKETKETIYGDSNIAYKDKSGRPDETKPGIINKTVFIKHTSGRGKLILYLPDSSKVYLNKNSELTYSPGFTKDERIVNVSGEVYFDVRKVKNRSFIVNTNLARVEVLGTSFCVRSFTEGKEEVIVESGRVLFSEKSNPQKNKILLTPGMKAYLNSGKPIITSLADHYNDLSWKTNKLVFHKAPLKDVIKEVETLFGIKIQPENSQIYDCHYTGRFDLPASVEEVLATIALSLNGSYEVKNKEYILKSKGCN